MKERLQCLLSEVGESFEYLRSDVRNLSRYMAELEALLERYRAFALKADLNTQTDKAARLKLLKRTQKVLGAPPDQQAGSDGQEASRTVPLKEIQMGALVSELLPRNR